MFEEYCGNVVLIFCDLVYFCICEINSFPSIYIAVVCAKILRCMCTHA